MPEQTPIDPNTGKPYNFTPKQIKYLTIIKQNQDKKKAEDEAKAKETADMYNNLNYNVGGGGDQAQLNLQAQQIAQQMEAIRMQTALGLLGNLQDQQRDPFNVVNALQSYKSLGGGGPLANVQQFAATGGKDNPSPYGSLAERLLETIGTFAGGAQINPTTGLPMTPQEVADYRLNGLTGPANPSTPGETPQPVYDADWAEKEAFPEGRPPEDNQTKALAALDQKKAKAKGNNGKPKLKMELLKAGPYGIR